MNNSLARICVLGMCANLLGCGAADVETETSTTSSMSLEGAWRFASSDIQPSTSFAIDGEVLRLRFSGYYRWNGTWSGGYRGYTFERPAALAEGGKYRLSLDVSNTSTFIPVVLRASLSGGGSEQQKSIQGNGTISMDFTIASDPGAQPVVNLTAHPVLGRLGPVEGTGIAVQSYDVKVSLTPVE